MFPLKKEQENKVSFERIATFLLLFLCTHRRTHCCMQCSARRNSSRPRIRDDVDDGDGNEGMTGLVLG